MTTKYIQNTFAGGMIDPTLQARTDLGLRYNSCKGAKNLLFLPSGACVNRTGTKHVVTSGNQKVYLVSFRYSITQQYVLEFSPNTIKVIKDDNYVLDPQDDTQPLTITTPYEDIDTIGELKFVQSADTLYILHKDYPVQELRRYADDDWRLVPTQFVNGPFEHVNTDDGLKVEICSGAQDYLISNQYYFTEDMKDSLFKINYKFDSYSASQAVTSASTAMTAFAGRGSFEIRSSGGWAGTVWIERSKDQNVWTEVKKWTSVSTSNPNNINYESQVDDDELYWYRFKTGSNFSGTINVSISRHSFDYYFICSIVGFDDDYKSDDKYSKAFVFINNGLSGLAFRSTSQPQVLASLIPTMASDTDNNITLSKSVTKSQGSMDYGVSFEQSDVYLAFDSSSSSTYFKAHWYKDGTIQSINTKPTVTLTITIDCTSNSGFSNGKIAEQIVRTDGTIYNSKASKPKTMVATFYFGGVVQKVVNDYNANGLGETISFDPVKFDKVVIVYSDFQWFQYPVSGTRQIAFLGAKFKNIAIKGYDVQTTSYQNTDFALGAFNEKNGYPCCGCFNNDRLVLAGTKSQPYTLWASKTGIYNDFGISDPMEETDSIDINLPSARRDCPDIYNLVNMSKLLVLSSSAESTVDLKEVSQTPQSQRGSSRVSPCVVGNIVLFVGTQNKTLREFIYDMLNDTYSSNEISYKVKSLLYNRTIKQLVYLQDPSSLVYVLLSDGSMLVLSYTKEENVVAFSTFEMDNAVIEDICGLDTGEASILYLSVNRDGTRYIEKLEPRFVDKTNSGVFLDCHSVYSNVSSVSGLNRFNNENVVCICDGEVMTKKVTDNAISFDKTYENVVVGLAYESRLELLSAVYENKQNLQTIVDVKARVCGVSCNWLYSVVDKIGIDEDSFNDIVVEKEENGLVTGITTQGLNSYSGYDKGIIYKHNKPFGFCLLSMILKLDLGTD